jgi:hypothetical protein
MKIRSFAALIAIGVTFAGCGGGSGQSAADATKEITANWTAFFDGTKTDNNSRTKLLENGAALQPAIAAAAANPILKTITAKVKDVAIVPPADCTTAQLRSPCAKVTYDLVAGTNPILPGATGYATRVGGHWVIAKTTFCALLSLQPPAPQGC